ncbi:MAG: hypothetical protein C3F02_01660 [Parcubacteria group bacterium]|nr:MAG: hypothetical protein C3F02_01660 [Parcubacteria group bacterium]
MKNAKIGFIGQGFVGKNYADAFEQLGHQVVRYDLADYKHNQALIAGCSLVFVAVPTPSTPRGFDDSILIAAINGVAPATTVIIKSTVKLGTTDKIQKLFPDLTIVHSPEFLREKHAAYDAGHPARNILGVTDDSDKRLASLAQEIMSLLPPAPYELITTARNAELIKYAGNCFLYTKVIFMNILFDLAQKYHLDYEIIKEALSEDPRIGPSHTNIIDQSGRGAGGHCFIKDFEVFINLLTEAGLNDQKNVAERIRNLNLHYLRESNKDLDLIQGIYGI